MPNSLIPLQIVVVPDDAAAQKVPPVPGLLKYRKDNMKLYVRSNETWNVIGEEKKVQKHQIHVDLPHQLIWSIVCTVASFVMNPQNI